MEDGAEEKTHRVIVAEIEGDHVIARFGNMRSYQTFTVYPAKAGAEYVIAQSHRSIVRIDVATGRGLWNPKGCYFPHLSPAMGAIEVDLPEAFVRDCKILSGMGRSG